MLIASSWSSGSLNDRRPNVAQEPRTAARTETVGMRDARCGRRLRPPRIPHPPSRIPVVSNIPFPLSRFPRDPFLHLSPERHPLRDGLLVPELAWLVPGLSPQGLRQIVLGHVGVLVRMRVLVAGSVSQLLHELGRGVPDVYRHRLRRMLVGRLHGAVVRRVHAVRLG